MGLFESGYRKSAKAELEKKVKEMEERARKERLWLDAVKMENDFLDLTAILNFAMQVELINAEELLYYKERAWTAKAEYLRMQRAEQKDVSERPVGSFMNMEDIKKKIEQEKNLQVGKEQTQTKSSREQEDYVPVK